jgi:SAM-dependent methyltransferase
MAAPTDPWNDPAFLRDVQYRTDANLAARQSIYAYQHPRIDLQARVIDLAAPAPGETVADVGCGNGAYLAELARRGFGGRVLGLDMSLGMLAAARERLISVGPVGAKVSLGAADRADSAAAPQTAGSSGSSESPRRRRARRRPLGSPRAADPGQRRGSRPVLFLHRGQARLRDRAPRPRPAADRGLCAVHVGYPARRRPRAPCRRGRLQIPGWSGRGSHHHHPHRLPHLQSLRDRYWPLCDVWSHGAVPNGTRRVIRCRWGVPNGTPS